jgi:hypothetical protein
MEKERYEDKWEQNNKDNDWHITLHNV